MGELGKNIRKAVRAAVAEGRTAGSTHVVTAVNIGGDGHSRSVYSDGEVTVVTTDGRTEVVRHSADDDAGDPPADPA